MTLRIEDLPEHLRPKAEVPEEAIESLMKALDLWMSKNHPGIKVYTIAEVAEILKCSERTVKGIIHSKKELQYFLVGKEIRVAHEALSEYIKNKQRPTVFDTDLLQ